MPSYISDLDDTQATWYQATNDGSGWKVAQVDKPAVGDYSHSEFRQSVVGTITEVETALSEILAKYTGKSAVCRLDRRGTLDGWKHRIVNRPVGASNRTRKGPRTG